MRRAVKAVLVGAACVAHLLPARAHAHRAWSERMLVTWYAATGYRMANGVYPYVGAAACGWDLRLGTRVFVPGVGTLVCADRIGYVPFRHIDVFNRPLGTSYRMVTVLG